MNWHPGPLTTGPRLLASYLWNTTTCHLYLKALSDLTSLDFSGKWYNPLFCLWPRWWSIGLINLGLRWIGLAALVKSFLERSPCPERNNEPLTFTWQLVLFIGKKQILSPWFCRQSSKSQFSGILFCRGWEASLSAKLCRYDKLFWTI